MTRRVPAAASGALRHRHLRGRDAIYSITKGDIRRMARRAGITRIGSDFYRTTRALLKRFLTRTIGTSVVLVEGRKRQTIQERDAVTAVQRCDQTFYVAGQ